MVGFYIPDFKLIIPEIILLIFSLFNLIEGTFRKNKGPELSYQFENTTIFVLLIALITLILQHTFGEKWVTFEGQIVQDDFIYFAKVLILIGSAAVVAISLPKMGRENLLAFEYCPLILLATVGMLLMVESNDFMSLFVSLEIQGLALYVLAAFNRNQLISSEAALKYFVLGALATCLYLYGSSLIYGFSGTTNFEVLTSILRLENNQDLPAGLLIGLIFIIASLAFKVSAVPFHMWTPDVYQGCSTPITAFIAAAPKVAAMAVLLRLMVHPFATLYGEWQSIISFISLCSMVLGAFAALGQRDLKRLLAYSAIGQMGYVLLGVAAGSDEGVQAVCVYLAVYLVTIIGTFGCILALRGKGNEDIQNIEDLSGISMLHPRIAFILAMFMFSLAGIPPLAGFFAKFYVFKAAISAGLFSLAIVGVLTSVVASYYYLKIIKVMYFSDIPEWSSSSYGQTLMVSLGMKIVINVCAIFTLLFCVFPNPMLEMAQRAALAFSG